MSTETLDYSCSTKRTLQHFQGGGKCPLPLPMPVGTHAAQLDHNFNNLTSALNVIFFFYKENNNIKLYTVQNNKHMIKYKIM